MKKRAAIAILALILLTGGIVYGVHHNNEVQARELAQKKHEERVQKNLDKLKSAEDAVDQAYKTRDGKEIESAKVAIDGLSDNQKNDKTKLNENLVKLVDLLKQASDLKVAMDTATKSRTDEDIKAVQALLNKVTDGYLKNDKKTIQDQLDTLKEQIVKDNEKKKDKAKADAEAQVAANAQAQQQQQAQVNAEQQAARNQQAYQEQPQQNYQAPAQQTPSQPSVGGGNPLPSGPTQGGGGNASGITDSPGGTDGLGDLVWEH